MNDLSEIVDALENKVSKLLHRYEKLKLKNRQLAEENEHLKGQEEKLQKDVLSWQEQCSSLQMANSMLGSNQYTRDTKLKINALIRELDECIVQLSE
ncbi:hypothetical protein [Altibacter sp. HG106]|uniref:hypothetical protein n=1 Tax=Altibacter sp. HG106 TaxID=3023937 RepID=UPI0023503E63|nr:hypothetical protein [Altibacter sp. HG106]MDC7996182.1 hypothetical protein [Altibacter sp. HG106]